MKQVYLFAIGILFANSLCAAPAERIIQESFPAQEVNTLSVKGFTGKIHVVAHESDKVELKLMLKPERGKKPNLSTVQLNSKSNDTELKLSLDVPFDRDDMQEEWEIRAPARLSVHARVEVGDLIVEGTAGDLDLSAGVGKILVDSGRGGVLADVGVGDVSVKSRSTSYGNVKLSANVGNTKLIVLGHRVVHGKTPGPGNRVALEGPGRDEFELKSNVGSVELEIIAP